MSDNSKRKPKALVVEAELLSGSNEFIREFFVDAPKNAELNDYVDFRTGVILHYQNDNFIDFETEASLLDRNDSFLDLTLAQHCKHGKTLEKLFAKAQESENLPLKLACLFNKTLYQSYPNQRIPVAFFTKSEFASWDFLSDEEKERINNWVVNLCDQEVEVLFSNETIDAHFLTEFLKAENNAWASLTEDRKLRVLIGLSRNRRVSEPFDENDYLMSGLTEYYYDELFHTIWDLAKSLPVTMPIAWALTELLEKTVDKRRHFDSFDVAKRWIIDGDEQKTKTAAVSLNAFESVRYSIYRNIMTDYFGQNRSNLEYFQNPDIAYRACSYRYLRNWSLEDIDYVFQKDNEISVRHLLMNPSIQRNSKFRERLHELCLEIDRKNPGDLIYISMYSGMLKEIKKKNPEFMKRDDESEWIAQGEKVLNLISLRDLIQESEEKQLNALSDEFLSLRLQIKRLSSVSNWLLGGGIFLAVLIAIF